MTARLRVGIGAQRNEGAASSSGRATGSHRPPSLGLSEPFRDKDTAQSLILHSIMTYPGDLIPPDDSGADTFARYCYQAYHAFPFCLDCILSRSVKSVTLEHIEDIVVEHTDHWRFIQVKTRDPEIGPWRLVDLLSDSGALNSLFRSYSILKGVTCRFEAHLEGSIKRGDPLFQITEKKTLDGALLGRISRTLGCSTKECRRFLNLVTVVPARAPRENVVDRNLGLLARAFPQTTSGTLNTAHQAMIATIQNAMSAQVFGDRWPEMIIGRLRSPRDVFEAKRLTAKSFGVIVQALTLSAPSTPAAAPTALTRVVVASDRVRQTLEPNILPRITRSRLFEKFIPAVERGLTLEQRRIIPIVGEAGYGKSTMLGELYDHFRDAGSSWVGLLRCDDVILGPNEGSMLDDRMGDAFTDSKTALSTTVAVLATTRRGLLLIDTLDLILDVHVLLAVLRLFRAIVRTGTTIVFTCRDHEYGEFFEPRQTLEDLAEITDRYGVPAFTVDEVFAASKAFVLKTDPEATERDADEFAHKISTLSADNRRIQEITRNPLLLGMLCELHGKARLVPSDLTVSALYGEYWTSRVAGSRKDGQYSQTALAKSSICLGIAQVCFSKSSARLVQVVSDNDLHLHAAHAFGNGLRELVSDGVLKRLSGERLRFFHQTFLEYAIARWLVTEDARGQRETLLALLSRRGMRGEHLHWWPVVRQLLTMLDAEEFRQVISALPIHELSSFRTTALAAGARQDSQTLARMVEVAIQGGTQLELVLCDALESVSPYSLEPVLLSLVELVRRGTSQGSARAGEVGGLLARFHPNAATSVIQSLFQAADARQGRATSVREIGIHAMTQFIKMASSSLRDEGGNAALAILRGRYRWFGTAGRLAMWKLHFETTVPASAKDALLDIGMQDELEIELRREVATLSSKFLTDRHRSTAADALSDFVARPLPKGWEVVQGAVRASLAAGSPQSLSSLLTEAIDGEAARFRVALQAVACLGTDYVPFLKLIRSIDLTTLRRAQIQRLTAIIRELWIRLTDLDRRQLWSWLEPAMDRWAEDILPLVGKLAHSEEAVARLLRLSEGLPPDRQAERLLKTLRALSPDVVTLAAPLLQRRIDALPRSPVKELALVDILKIIARESPTAFADLVKYACGRTKRVANSASAGLADLVADSADANLTALLTLSTSTFENVRANCVSGFCNRVTRGLVVDDGLLTTIGERLAHERHVVVLQRICELTTEWARAKRRVPASLLRLLDHISSEMRRTATIRDGASRLFIIALKASAQSEDPDAMESLSRLAIEVIATVNSTQTHEGDVIDLLSAVARVDMGFTARLIQVGDSVQPLNVRAIAFAIKRVDGLQSPLLDQMLGSDWCSPQARRAILESRG